MTFTRTELGLVVQYRFYKEPIVWVEGKTEVQFYYPLMKSMGFRILSYNGKNNAVALINALVERNHPYTVISDGDYKIIEGKRSRHRRAIILKRHSIENYFWDKSVIIDACCNYACCPNEESILENKYEDTMLTIEKQLYELILLDYAAQESEASIDVLPRKAEILLEKEEECTFNRDRIRDICTNAKKALIRSDINKSKKLFDRYLKYNRIVDVLNGHFIFCIIRKIIIESVKRKKGKKPNIDNDGLYQLLSLYIWSLIPSKHHIELRRKIRKATNETRKGLIEI